MRIHEIDNPELRVTRIEKTSCTHNNRREKSQLPDDSGKYPAGTVNQNEFSKMLNIECGLPDDSGEYFNG